MKFFIAFLLIGVFAAATLAAVDELEKQAIAQEAIDNLEALRIRKAVMSYGAPAAPAAPAYGPSIPSMPSIPCPKNYLFSCQPQLQPVACAPPAAYHQGAYSEPIAQWALPPQEN